VPRKPNPGDYDWTDAAIALLTDLWLCGYSSGECARRLGVSRNAVVGKLGRLNLLRRDRPRLPIMARRVDIQLPTDFPTVINRPPKKPRIRQNKRPLPPPEPYQAPPPPPLPPIGSFDLMDLRSGHCRWPCSDGFPPYKFCGAPQASQSSYCSLHFALAHNRGSQRDYDRAAEQALAGKHFFGRAGVME
jgi:GcrA cell cycle regulator